MKTRKDKIEILQAIASGNVSLNILKESQLLTFVKDSDNGKWVLIEPNTKWGWYSMKSDSEMTKPKFFTDDKVKQMQKENPQNEFILINRTPKNIPA